MNKPLTLEQLREMDGKPVWGKSLINDKPGEWFIIRIVEMSKNWFVACAGSEQGFGDKDNYGKTWIAYAYPPAHIDREAWEPCDTCGKKNCDNCKHGYDTAGENENCAKCMDESEWEPAYGFCPWCGRPMCEEAWEELEKRVMG